ncbi:hypothetical protein SDJN02_24529, partial [Cucurbita argyrosperma subsp. argyrosperma]
MALRDEQAVAAMDFAEELRWRKNENAIPLSENETRPFKQRINDSIITPVQPGSVGSEIYSSDRFSPKEINCLPRLPPSPMISMPFDQEKLSLSSDSLSRWVTWGGGAFVFGCLLAISTFKMTKKIITPSKMGQDDDSNLNVDGFRESTRCVDEGTRQKDELQPFRQSSSTNLISHSCHTTSQMLVKYSSSKDSVFDETQTLTTKSIPEKNDEENVVVNNYEEEEYTDSEKSVENEVAESFSSEEFDEATWLIGWTDKSSSYSLTSSSSLEEILSQKAFSGEN